MEFLAGIFVGAAIALVVVWWLVMQIKNQLLAEINQSESQPTSIVAKVEFVNNQYFCYNNETGQFLCQGNTLVEIGDKFLQQFPASGLILVADDQSLLDKIKKEYNSLQSNS